MPQWINFDYLNIFKEPALLGSFIVRHAFKRKTGIKSDAILIVNPCLIGEFAASAPAIHEIILKNKGKVVDLFVSPPLVSLARLMRGVRNVYGAKSVFARESEQTQNGELPSCAYEKVFVLRISKDAYRMLDKIETAHIETSFWHFIKYGIHLGWNILQGKTPKSWREINFAVTGTAPREISFDKIFSLEEQTAPLPTLQTKQKKIIIHTGASWATNHWDTKNWIELIKRLYTLGDFRFIFVGSGKDKDDYQIVSSHLPFQIYSLIGEIDIVELAVILRASDYFIGVDSGPRNFANLINLPSITLLGPGPHMYTPPNPRDIAFDRSKGRGLYQRFFRKKRSLFIDRISPEDVYEAFTTLLAQNDGSHNAM